MSPTPFGFCRAATAVDLSADMLAAVATEAERRGLRNLETVRASAENLPFGDGEFGFLASRFSARHWRDAPGGLRQARRVLRTAAQALFIDIVSPGDAVLDTHLQAIELLRDAGFAVEMVETWRLRMDFGVWTRRIGTPAPLAEAIRLLQQKAGDETRGYFAIEDDGSFLLDAAMFVAVAAIVKRC